MANVQKITPCLWFDDQGEEAARFYVSVFPDSRIQEVTRYGKAGHEIHGRAEGSVMTVTFSLSGCELVALNGGPLFKFNEAVSLQINCDDQAEIDHYWSRLSEGADPAAQQCGWLKDRYGLSWQVVPNVMAELMRDPDSAKTERLFSAMLKMKKLDIAELKRAHAG